MRLDQSRAPLAEAVENYLQEGRLSLHTPGHQGGEAAPARLRRLLGRRALRADLTELPGLDDLAAPEGPLAEAQALAADCFGAAYTFFLVNGATAGLQAAILAACRPGEKVLVARNCHRAALAGLVLAGAMPVYLRPRWSAEWGLYLGLEQGTVERALEENPDARALVLVNPTYEGVAAPLEYIVARCRERGVTVVVDEAHGGHHTFHPQLPRPALAAGADLVVHGTHKSMAALTQAGMLHLRERRWTEEVRRALLCLTTSSPSFLLLASLDLARREMALAGRRLVGQALQEAAIAREACGEGFPCLDSEIQKMAPALVADGTRLAMRPRPKGVSPVELAQALRRQGLEPELAGPEHLLLLFPPGARRGSGKRVAAALAGIQGGAGGLTHAGVAWPEPPLPRVVLPPREAFLAPRESVPLARAAGRVAAEMVAPYPPGIPVLCPGELVSDAVLDYLAACREEGRPCHGPADRQLREIGVVAG